MARARRTRRTRESEGLSNGPDGLTDWLTDGLLGEISILAFLLKGLGVGELGVLPIS